MNSQASNSQASRYGQRVGLRFGRRADSYERHALLQRAVAWRLGRLCRNLALPAGPAADLGAGTGLLSSALVRHHSGLRARPPLQLDLCPELLARNPWPVRQQWNLDGGLPEPLEGAALLASSFALQWLEAPAERLANWCRSLAPGGWLALAVPTAGSFPQWRHAASLAEVRCTALPLPRADLLLATTADAGLRPLFAHRLRFSRPRQGGMLALRHLRQLGADASRQPPLSASQLRRLLAHWPGETPLLWEVLLLVAQKPCPDPQQP